MEFLSTDDVLISIKPLGKIQALFLLSGTYAYFFLPMNGQSVNFLAATPDHHCKPREGYPVNQSIPYETNEHGKQVYVQCNEYVDPEYRNATQDCENGWEYDDVYGETIITEWDLVCTQSNGASEISQSVLMLGGLFGALFFGSLADRYGRRPSFLFALVLYDIAGLTLCLSVNYTMFIILRFFTGFGQMAFWVPLSSNLSEYMVPKYRSVAMTAPTIALSFGLMFMALLAFLIDDWRYLQLAMVAPMILATAFFWFLPESLRWLMSRGKDEQTKQLVRRLSKINGIDIPDSYKLDVNPAANGQVYTISSNDIAAPSQADGVAEYDRKLDNIPEDQQMPHSEKTLNPAFEAEIVDPIGDGNAKVDETEVGDASPADERKEKKSRKSYLDLFKPPVLYVTVVLGFLRFSHTLVYFGFALSTGRLAGNPYLNFFFSALVELPARLLTPVVYKRFRRTYLLSFLFGVSAIDLLAIMLVPRETKNGVDLEALITTLSLLGKFLVTLTMSGHMLLIAELFPTKVRNMGNGWTLCVGRIGAIFAPFMLLLDDYVKNFSTILMAVVSLLISIVILTLPDTRRTQQPQNTQELREILRSRKRRKNEKNIDDTKPEGTGIENAGYDEKEVGSEGLDRQD